MPDYLVACTAGSTAFGAVAVNPSALLAADADDPLLDLNAQEEQELPFLTVGCLGRGERVSVLVMETRAHVGRVEEMLAVGLDGCKRVREILDGVVRAHGRRMMGGGG